jgi:hypothetical protein
MRRLVLFFFLARLVPAWTDDLRLPLKPRSIRFAVIGDSGTGEREQYGLAQAMFSYHGDFPFEFVIMLGDNIYGHKTPADFKRKFEDPYRPLLDAGVKFYASLGNHDDPNERLYKPFNMDGKVTTSIILCTRTAGLTALTSICGNCSNRSFRNRESTWCYPVMSTTTRGYNRSMGSITS